jgi:hypothetical protein
MARITTNTTTTQPVIVFKAHGVSADTTGLTVPFIQDLTITNSTGVYSYTTFTDIDTRKLSTPANNELSTNIVIDDEVYFGNSSATANTASFIGISKLSTDKILIDFQIFWTGNTSGTSDRVTTGQGFISSLAPKTSPTAPVWVTPMTVAVDGSMVTATNG